MRKPTDLQAHFGYLDMLRSSGVTNMYGAGAYLERDQGLSQSEARIVLKQWMETFDGESTVEARSIKAMGE